MKNKVVVCFLLCYCFYSTTLFGQSANSGKGITLPETFPKLKDGFIPETVKELWKDYDPMKEPLDVEILDQWKEDGVVCKVIRYRIGVFKGKKSMMAALYAYPEHGKKLPGLVQVHGGGQNASLNAVMTNARRGYACISVNWGGNPMSGLKNGKNWVWTGLNTDWGAIDPTQNGHMDHFYTLMPDSKTIDSVYSPRNGNWWLDMVGVRRAITFLQKQPEVNPELIGLYGHSMGGWLTFNVSAIDKRVKAAAPSAASHLGPERDQESDIRWRTEASKGYAPYQTCPIMFINPSNDQHGRIEEVEETLDAIPSENVMITRDPQLNHRTQPNHVVCGLLWMDQYLKKDFTFPANPKIVLTVDTMNHTAVIKVKPDVNANFMGVDVYYTTGDEAGGRYWEWAKAEKKGDIWYAQCPVSTTTAPLRIFANIDYSLNKPVSGASFYYELYTAKKFTISSRMITVKPGLLKLLNIKAVDTTSLMIETFDSNWQKRWYEFGYDEMWPYRTHKLNDKKWYAPSADASLSLEVMCANDNILQIDVDDYAATVALKGSNNWQVIKLMPSDFKIKDPQKDPAKPPVLPGWKAFNELALGPKINAATGKPNEGEDWKGVIPTFRNLQWVTSNKEAVK